MTQPGQSVTLTTSYCPACRRARFGRTCVECGGPLRLGEFVLVDEDVHARTPQPRDTADNYGGSA